jgi:hypothetical protein
MSHNKNWWFTLIAYTPCTSNICVLSSSPQESINIWWINDALRSIGLSPLVSTPCNPVSEAVFNFVLAWAGMFLPVLLTDGASQKVEKKVRRLTFVAGHGAGRVC